MDNNLYTLNKLKKDIAIAKCFSFLLPKEQRQRIKRIGEQLSETMDLINSFNKYYSDLGWCTYDSMNLSVIKEAVTAYETSGIDAGESILLKYYQEGVKEIIHWLKNKAEPFAQRYELIQRTFDDHFAGRYYASVPLFLIIIDGSVNDYTKSKGFFAEGTDLSAWDCLVGCSDSLMKMRDIFNKGRNKTNQEEIRMPYRNGILHGRDLNYSNKFVSCKCVSLLFALADWMCMKDTEEERKEQFEKKNNPPPLSESIKKLKEYELEKEEMSRWHARDVIIDKDIPSVPQVEDCVDYQYIIPIIETFNAWKSKNYGLLSIQLQKLFPYEKSESKRAGACRQMFSSMHYCAYKLIEVEERSCSMVRILVQADWEVNEKHLSELLEFGCMYQDENGKPVLPWRGDGKWTLIPWKVQGLYKM